MKSYYAALIASIMAVSLTACTVPPSGGAVEIVPEWSDKNLNGNSQQDAEAQKAAAFFPEVELSEPISLKNLDPEKVRAVAGRILFAEYQSLPVSPSKIKHVLSPTIPKTIQEDSLKTWQIGSNLFNDVSDLSRTWVFWTTPKDFAWINDALCKEANYCDTGKEYYYNVGNAMKKNGCDNLGGELSMGGNNLVVECFKPEEEKDYSHVGTHEYGHFVEMETDNDKRYTSWWTEGTATYFSFFIWAIKDQNYDTYFYGVAGMDFTLQNQSAYKVPEHPTVADYEYMLDLVDDDRSQKAWSIGYYLGALSVEALVASFGIDVIKKHYKLVGEIGWHKAFKKSFGVTTEEFRKIVAPYLKARHDLDKALTKNVN